VTLNPQLDQAQIELSNLYLGDYLIETTKNASTTCCTPMRCRPGHAGDAESLLKLKITNNPPDRDSVLQLAEHY
jgi:hypothetical protein